MRRKRKLFEERGSDKIYIALRDELNPRCKDAKKFVEELWQGAHRFVDPDILDDIHNQFHARFWELYMAASLLEAKLPLQESTQRDGPDLCISSDKGERIWIEAVSASPGSRKDAVPELAIKVVSDVPDKEMKLRLLSGFSAKFDAYKEYRKKNWIAPNEPYVIAINDGLIYSRFLDVEPPRIVRSLLPIGFEVLHIDPKTMKAVDRTHEYQGAVLKSSGAEISTTSFLNPEFSGISAVIYSPVDAINRPGDNLPGALLLFHNPLAVNPLPRGFLGKGHEYWVESGEVKHKNWHVTATDSQSPVPPDADASAPTLPNGTKGPTPC